MDVPPQIIVCLKQVPDPDAPPSAFQVDSEKKRVIPKGVPPVISPYDENALEAALRLKDKHGARIIALSMGKNLSKRLLVKAIAAGADELVLLQDDAFDDLGSYGTAVILAAAIRKLGRYELILCGSQAADTNAGQVGIGIAEVLDIPCVSSGQAVDFIQGNLRVESIVPDGYEVLEMRMPAVVTVCTELYVLRYPSFVELREAQKKVPTTWGSEDLMVDVRCLRRNKLVGLFPRTAGTKCELLTAPTMRDLGLNLALRLREEKII
jgi:electron transfer flavoprotein beta subunit